MDTITDEMAFNISRAAALLQEASETYRVSAYGNLRPRMYFEGEMESEEYQLARAKRYIDESYSILRSLMGVK